LSSASNLMFWGIRGRLDLYSLLKNLIFASSESLE